MHDGFEYFEYFMAITVPISRKILSHLKHGLSQYLGITGEVVAVGTFV